MQDINLLKFMSAKTLLSQTYTEGSPGYLMYIHDSISLFKYSSEVYHMRHFVLLGPFKNFKQTTGSYRNFLSCNDFVSTEDLLLMLFTMAGG